MTIEHFIEKYNKTKIDFDDFYGGQCVDLFRQYCYEVLNIPQAYPTISDPGKGRGACDFWLGFDSSQQLKDNFTQIKNDADFKPIRGDVMIWNRRAGGGHGHIAVCTGNDTDLTKFESFDQNWSKLSFCELVSHSYTNVYGVLRPKQQEVATIPIATIERDNLIKRSTILDEFEKAGYSNAKAVELITNSLKENAEDIKREYDKFVLDIVTKLNPTGSLAPVTDKNYALQLVDGLISEKDVIQKELKIKEDEYSRTTRELEAENLRLETELNKLRTELEQMELKHTEEIERLKKRLETVSKSTTALKDNKTQTRVWLNFIQKLLKGIK